MSFDISLLKRSDRIVGAGAIALFIFMFFFHWLGASAHGPFGVSVSGGADGWHSFTNSRWIWLLTILVALALVVATAGGRQINSPVQPAVLVAGLGALSTLLILYRIVHHPHGGFSGSVAGVSYSSSYGIKIGIWLGLIAAATIAYGGYEAMRAEGTSLADVREQASGAFSGLTSHASAAPPAGATAGAAPAAASETPPAPPIPPPAAAPSPPATPEDQPPSA